MAVGYIFVREEFGRFLNLLSDVIEVGINVVLTAHMQMRKFELPNEGGSFDRYELKLGKKDFIADCSAGQRVG